MNGIQFLTIITILYIFLKSHVSFVESEAIFTYFDSSLDACSYMTWIKRIEKYLSLYLIILALHNFN